MVAFHPLLKLALGFYLGILVAMLALYVVTGGGLGGFDWGSFLQMPMVLLDGLSSGGLSRALAWGTVAFGAVGAYLAWRFF